MIVWWKMAWKPLRSLTVASSVLLPRWGDRSLLGLWRYSSTPQKRFFDTLVVKENRGIHSPGGRLHPSEVLLRAAELRAL